MTKSKPFWAVLALVSLAAAIFAGYSIYARMTQHFSGDTIEVRPVPAPAPPEGPAPEEEARQEETPAGTPQEADAAAPASEQEAQGKQDAEPARTRAVKTLFTYRDAKARSVEIAGSFTSWKNKRMVKKDGVWRAEVYILPGNYPYHFTVDGKKKTDPGKPLAPTGDSLVKVESRN